ncbi:1,2-phenylacetyl-CoA epoxidase subunit PaaE [Streptomyces ipomoeae]|uniref:3-ketosteroid-9-alpha-monooxygenase, ferredoxin reductase component n=1 Tax=Streptomyces ipomoeae 91-03 TaxID=698759 RepID=L1KRN6_9ACTN|nr:1,2-phenylacetyl-CoA epoxidase subunit PaaE [Streptomyces ipomoeae]EKX63456.1 phenylacetate-CoA oxygenase/reductase, PaaK subunit [Streptomyces ipomoeae 91-03]MDX2701057.1 phenylacetate-CoA oxygenase/reductase subunit PaaK [Streptomyces ipomoeae]MDX2846675.1 phenylacetate-CoA oxygenase/reductase subunit PaaK [Streptomyces ipomoeae]TQE35493.1 phenylacetate-CoA oxygenase/reductase subunit PaaK [Streptomyces ipomoeae]
MEGLREEPTGTVAAAPTPEVRPRPRRRPAFHRLRVADVQPLCEDAVAVGFEIPDELAEEFAFLPGQSLTLRREVDGRDERRSYSICSPVGSAPRIGVRVVPGGLFSSWLVGDVRPGDTVEVMAPTGFFTPDLATPGHHVLIAAGSGITPMISIAESVLAADARSTVTLFYGNRRSGTVMFADELADLKDLYPARFQLAHVLSREPREAEVLSGRLDAERLSALIDALVDVESADHWWLCGPHGMVRDARQVLAGLGVPADRVHQELFHADDEPVREVRHEEAAAEGPVSEVTVTLDGRSTTAPLSRERTILDGAQRTRPDLPFACKGGVCGTCRALITDGKADMRRNFALEPSEVEAGYVLTCQSYPVSETLTVDYDS